MYDHGEFFSFTAFSSWAFPPFFSCHPHTHPINFALLLISCMLLVMKWKWNTRKLPFTLTIRFHRDEKAFFSSRNFSWMKSGGKKKNWRESQPFFSRKAMNNFPKRVQLAYFPSRTFLYLLGSTVKYVLNLGKIPQERPLMVLWKLRNLLLQFSA